MSENERNPLGGGAEPIVAAYRAAISKQSPIEEIAARIRAALQ